MRRHDGSRRSTSHITSAAQMNVLTKPEAAQSARSRPTQKNSPA